MATIKSYTDLQQSRKLAEILPLESADMMYHSVENEYGSGAFVATSKVITNGFGNDDFHIDDIPCWSLAALFDVLPNKIISHETTFDDEDAKDINEIYYKHIESKKEGSYVCCYVRNGHKYGYISDNPVDACVAMIERLHELKML